MAKLKTCKHCGAEIAKNAKVCPNCGGKNKKPIYLRWWFIALVIIVIIVAVGGSGSSKTNTTQQIGTVEQKQGNQAATGKTNGTDTKATEKTNNDTSKKKEPTPEPKTTYNVGDILQDGNVLFGECLIVEALGTEHGQSDSTALLVGNCEVDVTVE